MYYGLVVEARPNLTIKGAINQLVMDGDVLRSVGGFSDLFLGATYLKENYESTFIFNVDVTLPTGRQELPATAFESATVMALSQYNFRQPYYGQGSVISPSIGWVRSAGDNLSFSVGMAYRFKGQFRPFEGLTEDYNWGNELAFFAGIDWRIHPIINVKGDIALTSYKADKFGDTEVYSAGDRVNAALDINIRGGRHDFGVRSTIRHLSDNLRILVGLLEVEPTKAFPNLLELGAYTTLRLNRTIALQLDGMMSGYGEALDGASMTVYSVTARPSLAITSRINIPLHFRYNFGDLTGMEAGGSLVIVL
jgi:hypothetical protein